MLPAEVDMTTDTKRTRPPSRPARWADAAGRAVKALTELQEIQAEYQEWLDNLPDNLQGSALADKLNEVTGYDIDGALDTAQDAEGADLPRGFGRD